MKPTSTAAATSNTRPTFNSSARSVMERSASFDRGLVEEWDVACARFLFERAKQRPRLREMRVEGGLVVLHQIVGRVFALVEELIEHVGDFIIDRPRQLVIPGDATDQIGHERSAPAAREHQRER